MEKKIFKMDYFTVNGKDESFDSVCFVAVFNGRNAHDLGEYA